MLLAGELPNLARLRRLGDYRRLGTTCPAQTPVAWSTFATGVNPGGHGIFDFLRRDPSTYGADLALTRYEQPNAFLPPRAVNLRGGTPLWEALTLAGVPSVILRCPCTYPPDSSNTRLLSGMGVTDLRGGLGTATLLTSAPAPHAREGEQVVPLQLVGPGARYRSHLVGPRNPRTRSDVTTAVDLEVDAAAGTASLSVTSGPQALPLALGTWSPWIPVRFRAGLLTSIRAVVRVLLTRVTPHIELYVSPANFDPRAPWFPISHPERYAAELAEAMGSAYYTTGMVEDHTGLSNGRFDEETFLAQCNEVMREREWMLQHELARLGEGLLFVLFDTPDRVQHMFWRFGEPSHPANREDALRCADMGRVIADHYRQCDGVIGRAMAGVDGDTLLLVISDHGFTSFQRGVNLNNWLHDNGYLTLRTGLSPRSELGDGFRYVDWSRTQAYAMGLGSVYLNIRGRERDGIVPAERAREVGAQLAERLAGLRDSARGATAIRAVRTREELYHGQCASESPDAVVEFERGYRVSWATALGGFGDAHVEDNTRKWGGDHIVSPVLVPGVLFSSHTLAAGDPHLVDMAPTLLSALGVPAPRAYEGRSFLPS